jgi:thiol-disulfide isomerase/thioredoxin
MLAALVATMVCLGLPLTAPAADYAAPDWTLPTPDGEEVSLHDALERGPVVVAFWATWCIPCLKELPHLNDLAAEYADEATVLAVSVDNSKSMAKVGPLVRSRGWDDLVVALDAAGEVQQTLQVLAPPFTVVYDAAGREVYRHEGYRPGDEEKLRAALEATLAAPEPEVASGSVAPGGLAWRDAITATNQFEYSYSTEDDDEIVENWLDVAYQFGDFRTGVMLNHQQPSEEGNRRTEVVHRYFEFTAGQFDVRAGHFYGMFGRGLVWNSYEDRFIRVDTALDGLYAKGSFGPVAVQAMSGATGTTPTLSDPEGTLTTQVDVRGLDVEWRAARGVSVGAAAVTYVPELLPASDETKREWVGTGRVNVNHELASLYLEYGKKTGYEFDRTTLDKDEGLGFYGNLGVYLGPVSLSVERSDYDRFRVLERVDGKQPLNRPPALVREHVYSLLGRKPHNLNPNDEKGWQIEANADLGQGWAVLGNVSRVEEHAGPTLYEEAYGHIEQEHLGPFRVRAGFGYQDSEGAIRQTVVADATYYASDDLALSTQIEHQHVRLGVLGEYDQQWIKLEADLLQRWSFTAISEFNNKYEAQFDPGEIRGDVFPAGQITYALSGGGNLNLWFGKRQAGQVCAGGVCKFEPAFEGVEFYGIFRY